MRRAPIRPVRQDDQCEEQDEQSHDDGQGQAQATGEAGKRKGGGITAAPRVSKRCFKTTYQAA